MLKDIGIFFIPHNSSDRRTLDRIVEIEIKAMAENGIPKNIATGCVIMALEDLKVQGVKYNKHSVEY